MRNLRLLRFRGGEKPKLFFVPRNCQRFAHANNSSEHTICALITHLPKSSYSSESSTRILLLSMAVDST
jgi:hypothetical protein